MTARLMLILYLVFVLGGLAYFVTIGLAQQ
ncbi:hypothetical protein SAMN05216174_102432 [Actinokineospora iranica]|uniref:Uncharacterized protein n=1 Tax=Actinokineospora iranica TaxID=1271860 RepID=A0A1G6M9J2_9PSEU|nr:hypothetical protein SAMN05216174_102432 [Actinokineospora iranica]